MSYGGLPFARDDQIDLGAQREFIARGQGLLEDSTWIDIGVVTAIYASHQEAAFTKKYSRLLDVQAGEIRAPCIVIAQLRVDEQIDNCTARQSTA